MSQHTLPTRLLDNSPLLLLVLLLVDSLHFVFARLLLPHLPPGVSAMFVMLVATLEMGIFLGVQKRIRLQVLRQHLRFFLTIGFLVGGATALTYTAVAYIDPGTASMLAQSSTIFALGFSMLWLGERMSKGEMAGALLALAGVFTISFQGGDVLRLGSLIVLIGAFMYAMHAAVVKRSGSQIEFGNFFLFRVASITFFLLLYNLGTGGLELPDLATVPLLLLVGTVDVLISRVLYYVALRRLRLSFHAIILTVSPVVTVLWSLLLFRSQPTLQGLVGGAAVIGGVAIVSMRRHHQQHHRAGAAD